MSNVRPQMNHALTLADRIWKRAFQGGGENPQAGDSALAGLFVFHGVARNCGVLHASECLSASQLHEASLGFRFFGFAEVADLLERITQLRTETTDIEALEAA